MSRDKYLEKAWLGKLTPYAFIRNYEWHGKGDMGWFGISSNEMNEDTWQREFYKMLKGLPEDTLLSLYDCHI